MDTRLPVIVGDVEAGLGDNGELSIVEYVRGKQTTLNAYIIDPATNFGIDLSSDTVTLEIFEDHRKRKYSEGGLAQVGGSDDGVQATVAAAASTSAVAVFTIADTDATFTALSILPRKNYYGHIKIVDSSDSNRIKFTKDFEFKVL